MDSGVKKRNKKQDKKNSILNQTVCDTKKGNETKKTSMVYN